MKVFSVSRTRPWVALVVMVFSVAATPGLGKEQLKTYPFTIALEPWSEEGLTELDVAVIETTLRQWLSRQFTEPLVGRPKILPAVIKDMTVSDDRKRLVSGELTVIWDNPIVRGGIEIDSKRFYSLRKKSDGSISESSKELHLSLALGSAFFPTRRQMEKYAGVIPVLEVRPSDTRQAPRHYPLSAYDPETMNKACDYLKLSGGQLIPLADGMLYRFYRPAYAVPLINMPLELLGDIWKIYLAEPLDEAQLTRAVKTLRQAGWHDDSYGIRLAAIAAITDRGQRLAALTAPPAPAATAAPAATSTLGKAASDGALPAAEEGGEHRDLALKIIRRNIGSGKHSVVDLVEDPVTGALYAWKQPVTDAREHYESFAEEIKRSVVWREIGISKIHVKWAGDGKSLLKTYVKGKTLRDALGEDSLFLLDEMHPMYIGLKIFIQRLLASKHYVGDLNSKNIIFDGHDWQVIDSGGVSEKRDKEAAADEYLSKLPMKWVKQVSFDTRMRLYRFLAQFRSKPTASYEARPTEDDKAFSLWRACRELFD